MGRFKRIIDIIQVLSLFVLLFSIIRFFIVPIYDIRDAASLSTNPDYFLGNNLISSKIIIFFYTSLIAFIIYFIVATYIFKRNRKNKDTNNNIISDESPFDITYLVDGYFSKRSFVCLLMKLINTNILNLNKDEGGYFLEIANKRDIVNPEFNSDIYFVESLFSEYARNDKVYIKYLSKGLNKNIDKIFANYCTVYLKEKKDSNYFLEDNFIFIISVLYLSGVFYSGIYLLYDYKLHLILLLIIYMTVFLKSFKIKYYTKYGLEVLEKWSSYKNSLIDKKVNPYSENTKFDDDVIYLIAFNINTPIYSQMFKDISVKSFIPTKNIPTIMKGLKR